MTTPPSVHGCRSETEAPLLRLLMDRARNATSPLERHNAAYYLAECTIKLATALRAALWIEHALAPESEPAKLLEQLLHPSLGHWTLLFQRLDRELAATRALGEPLRTRLESPGRTRVGMPAVAAWAREAFQRRALSAQQFREASSGTIAGFVSVLGRYRNDVIGHGAQRDAEFYEALGAALLAACLEVVSSPAMFLGMTLETRTSTDDDEPRAVFADGSVAFDLSPIVAVEPGSLGPRVGIINRSTSRSAPDRARRELVRVHFLDYLSGDSFEVPWAAAQMTRMLSRLRGQSIGLEDIGITPLGASHEGEVNGAFAGEVFGDFELVTQIGRGGMGVVFDARQATLGRHVALKILTADLARNELTVDRFRREIGILGRSEHPNVIKVYTSGVEGDRYYYAMELVDGLDLARLIERLRTGGASVAAHSEAALRNAIGTATSGGASTGPAWRKVAELFAGAAEGLGYLHRRGVVHRDVKPANLMLTADLARLVVMDLGLAATDDATAPLTRSEAFLGTYQFAAPEQIAGNSHAAFPTMDVFSLGRTLHALLSVMANGATAAASSHSPTSLPTAVPRDLRAIVTRAIEPIPNDRYVAMSDFADDLHAFVRGEPPSGVRFRRTRKLLRTARANPIRAGLVAMLQLAVLVSAGLAVRFVREGHADYCTMVWRRGVPMGELAVGREAPEFRYRVTRAKGKVRRVERLNPQGALAEDDERHATWDVAYDEQGEVRQVVVGDALRHVTLRWVYKDGIGTVWREDATGASYPEPSSLVTGYRQRWDPDGHLAARASITRHGPRPDAERVLGYALHEERDGDVLAQVETAVDEAGRPVRRASGFATVRLTTHAGEALRRLEYLGIDGAPAAPEDGIARVENRWDPTNLVATERYFDVHLAPTMRAGCAARERAWSADALHVRCLDPMGATVAGSDGYAIEVVSTVRNGASRRTFLDANGQPTLRGFRGCASLAVEVTAGAEAAPRGWTTTETCLGIDGRPLVNANNYSKRLVVRDEQGRRVDERYLTPTGDTAQHVEGYARFTAEYTGSGRVVRYLVAGQWFSFEEARDADGNVLERACFDGEHKRRSDSAAGGFWRVVRTYERGLLAGERYYDVNDEPTQHLCGFFSRVMEYDAQGRRVGQRFLDRSGATSAKVVRYTESPSDEVGTTAWLKDAEGAEKACETRVREW